MDKTDYLCRICGFDLHFKPWGDDGNTPSFDICPCCGVEFGYEDYCLESIRDYRTKWQLSGYPIFDKSSLPKNFNLKNQLNNIPKIFI